MATENNRDNKAAFVAQYYGQKVVTEKLGSKPVYMTANHIKEVARGTAKFGLLLQPIEDISDKDLQDCINKLNEFSEANEIGGDPSTIEEAKAQGYVHAITGFTPAADLLRSRGYLVAWRDLTVFDIIGYGWLEEGEEV